MAAQGSSQRPNDWTVSGAFAPQEQADWYQSMFDSALRRSWVGGFAFWDWQARCASDADCGYNLRGTQALSVIRRVYRSKDE